MRRTVAADAEIARSAHQALAEMILPHAVHDHTRGERIVVARNRAGQVQPAARSIGEGPGRMWRERPGIGAAPQRPDYSDCLSRTRAPQWLQARPPAPSPASARRETPNPSYVPQVIAQVAQIVAVTFGLAALKIFRGARPSPPHCRTCAIAAADTGSDRASVRNSRPPYCPSWRSL